MSYVLDVGKTGHGLEDLAELHLQHKPVTVSDLTGKGRDRIRAGTGCAFAGDAFCRRTRGYRAAARLAAEAATDRRTADDGL